MRQGKHRILIGDVLGGLRSMQDGCVRCCVTSPPYWGLRDYGVEGQIGLESTPEAYIERMVGVFREVRRVLAEDGTVFLNVGDSYASVSAVGGNDGVPPEWQRPSRSAKANIAKMGLGLKPKDLVGIPWMLAFALRADGWYLRSDIVWSKPNPMPESVTDRPTKSHEYIFLLSKRERYYYDADAVREECTTAGRPGERRSYSPGSASSHRLSGGHEAQHGSFAGLPLNPLGRNARSVWQIATQSYPESHFATFPEALPERCIKAGSSELGKCPECGAAWVRKAERTTNGMDVLNAHERDGDTTEARNGKAKCPSGLIVSTRTIGWEPTCDHGHDHVPDVVLDPFAGSGTTLLVACRLGRDAIGCELNPQYAAMAERRIGSGLRPATFRDESVVGGDGLFARAVHDA